MTASKLYISHSSAHCRVVSKDVWALFSYWYSGGPVIKVKTMDVAKSPVLWQVTAKPLSNGSRLSAASRLRKLNGNMLGKYSSHGVKAQSGSSTEAATDPHNVAQAVEVKLRPHVHTLKCDRSLKVTWHSWHAYVPCSDNVLICSLLGHPSIS